MNGACFVTGQRVIDLIEFGFNDTSTLVGHFVSSPRKREKRDLFVLRFYGPVNPMGSCRARSVYLTTRLLGRLSPLSG